MARVVVSKCEQGIDEKKILSTINTSFYLSQFHRISPIFTTWNDTGNDTQNAIIVWTFQPTEKITKILLDLFVIFCYFSIG